MTSIKLIYGKEIRRTSINLHSNESSLTYDYLKILVFKLYPSLQTLDFQICYHDDENDLVTFSSDEELEEAIKFMLPKSSTLKFTVQVAKDVPTASSTNREPAVLCTIPVETPAGNGKESKTLTSKSTTTTATLTTLTKTSNKLFVLPSVSFTAQEALAASALLNNGMPIHSSSIPADDYDDYEGEGGAGRDESYGGGNEYLGLTNFNSTEENNGKVGFKRRRCYTVAEKYEIVKEYLCNRNNMTQFALERNIKPKTFSAWMKEYQDGKLDQVVVSGQDTKRFRLRKAEYPEIEKLLIDYILEFDPSQVITWALIRTHALQFAKELLNEEELQHFKASDGWIQNFLKRNNIILKKNYIVQIGGGASQTGSYQSGSGSFQTTNSTMTMNNTTANVTVFPSSLSTITSITSNTGGTILTSAVDNDSPMSTSDSEG